MQIKTSKNNYGIIRKANHWLVATIFMVLLAAGNYMTSLADTNPAKWEIYPTHKSMGFILLMLVIFRIIWLKFDNRIDNSELTKPERIGSASVHGTLYLLMLIMPISGIIMSMSKGYGVEIFKLFSLPMLIDKNETLAMISSNIHIYGGKLAAALVILHILASIYHHFVRKDNILKRMI